MSGKAVTARWEKLRSRVIFVSNYQDWPLSGDMMINGSMWSFERLDPFSFRISIRRMGRLERAKRWLDRTVFGVCVGWHWHAMPPGSKRSGPHLGNPRKPKWLYGALFNLYYYHRPYKRRFKKT